MLTETQKQQFSDCQFTIENMALSCKARHSYSPTDCPLRIPITILHAKHVFTKKMNKEYDELCNGYTAKDRLIAGIDTI